jgi:hypothetical protein
VEPPDGQHLRLERRHPRVRCTPLLCASVPCVISRDFEMPLFTQTRQGLEKKVMSEEYENLLLWGLCVDLAGPEGATVAGQGA